MTEEPVGDKFRGLSDNPAVIAAFRALTVVLDQAREAFGRDLFAADRILRASEYVAKLAEIEQREFEAIYSV